VKYFQTGKTGYWGGLNNTSLALIAAGLISYGFDLSIGEGKPRPQEVEAFKQEILNEVGSIDPANDPMSGIQLYSYNMANFSFPEHPEFVSNGWTTNSEGIKPSVAGLGGIVYINKQVNIETKIQRVVTVLGNNTALALLTVGKEESTLKTIVSVNAGNNSLNIYDIYSGSSLPSIRATKTIPFSIVAGRQYIVEMYRKGRANGIRITDFLTGQSDYLEVYPTQAVHGSDAEVYVGGLQYDVFGVCHLSGTTPTIKHISCGYFGKKNPLLWIGGDSITYGYGTNALSLTYAHLIGKMTGGDYVVSPRGGGKIGGILEKIQTECSIIKPKFIMVTIGTNQAASEAQLQQLITDIKAIGSIPIINCIPCRTNGEQMTANNRILTLGEYCCRFDLATAIDPTASTLKADLSLYVDGGVHPNTTGFKRMADRVRIDLPFLF
jgi:hypothetical protein